MLKLKSLVALATAVLVSSAAIAASDNTVGYDKGILPVYASGTTDSNGLLTVYLATSGVGNTLTDLVSGISVSVVSTNNGVLTSLIRGAVSDLTSKDAGKIVTNVTSSLTNIISGISNYGPTVLLNTNISTIVNAQVTSITSNAISLLAYLNTVSTSNQTVYSVLVGSTTGSFTNVYGTATNVLTYVTGLTTSNIVATQTLVARVPVANKTVKVLIPVAVSK